MNDVLQQELSPAVMVTIGGKQYSLLYDLQAVVLYKQKTGDSLFADGAFSQINPTKDPERFIACLWSGLQRRHPELTIAALGEMIPFGPQINPLVVAVSKALTAHFPKAKEGASPNDQAPENTPAQIPVDLDAAYESQATTTYPSSAPLPVSISG